MMIMYAAGFPDVSTAADATITTSGPQRLQWQPATEEDIREFLAVLLDERIGPDEHPMCGEIPGGD